MVTKLYCYCNESFKTNKIDNNIEWLIKGYEKKSWDYETENLPWNNKSTYHKDYKEIRNLYYEAIKYIESQKNYREIFKNRLHRERQTKIIAGSIARFLVIQIVKTNRGGLRSYIRLCLWHRSRNGARCGHGNGRRLNQ